MTPVFLFLIFLSWTAVPLGAVDDVPEMDESLDVSTIIQKVNTDTRFLVHGDIRQSRNRNAAPCTAKGCKWRKKKGYVRVPVTISPAYFRDERNIIIRAMLEFHRTTCIRFYWKRSWHRNYIDIFSGYGCWSYVGRQKGGQRLSLMRNGCLIPGTVQHEILHALGFHHEQVRSDRDSYVSILTQNIMSGREINFKKVQTNNLATSYDFNSIMHYNNFAFSRNGQPTIVAKSNPNLRFGQSTMMSANDIARVNKLYQCGD